MKRLRVLVVCLIVALLCWYPNYHAYCSEHSLSDPGQPAQDKHDNDDNRNNHPNDPTQEQDSVQLQEVEEWTTHTSYDTGLETERAAQNIHQEQTVNPQVAEEEAQVTDSDPVSDPRLAAPEPESSSEPMNESDLRTDAQNPVQVRDQDGDQETAVSSSSSEPGPAQDHVSNDTPAPAETLGDEAAAHQDPATPTYEADDTPTSQSDGPTPTGEDDKEDQGTDQNQDTGPEAVAVQSTSSQVEEQQEEEREQQKDDDPSLQQQQQQAGEAGTGKESDPSVPSKDDIPTFDEWKKKVMEVEKEKSQNLHTAASGIAQPVKKVQKNFKNNYASVECGAKILSANTEAKSTSAILMENMDLYMLNPCSNKIWFVIELCEPIQVKQLDIANFELFSSTPKDFLVSLSDRYPTNKWVKLGTFHARDERIVQSFPLDEQLYAKYVKVELLSHFGSEHFCPLSLFRVFGTSMVEEYEEIADSQYPSERLEFLDEDYDYPPGYQPSEDKASKNLLGSATNAILNMVNNIAANVLGGKPELEGQSGAEGNGTAEVLTNKEESVEAAPATLVEISQNLTIEKPVEPEEHTVPEDGSVPSTSPSSLEHHTDIRIVTLVEEEDDEDPRQSTVTLLEEEEEEEDKREEDDDMPVDRESAAYCPFLSLSSLSCLATLPELLQRWCSAMLAKERLRKLDREKHPIVKDPNMTHPQIPIAIPTPSQEALPLSEKTPEPEVPLTGQNEGQPQSESLDDTTFTHSQLPDFQLEPSRISSLHPHSFSDIHSSLTPTHRDMLLPPINDATLNRITTPPLQTAPVSDTQRLSATPPPLVASPPQQLPAPETDIPDAALPSAKEQELPTASHPEDPVPHSTEQLTAPLSIKPDAVSDLQKSDQQKANAQPEEHGDTQGGEPHRAVDPVEDELVNGSAHRAATDFYAELQNGGDYNGVAGGNGVMSNGAAVHGSSQKESVFMRLNNRIKALEMNMSLSGRYLEELSQRYRKQMEEMQKAFNKTVIKLQNTSRMAEEQDQKQQDSIQVLQSQLENITKLMLNLTVAVGQLQKEVSDRQSYLVVSLALCVSLGLLVCLQCCRSSCAASRPAAAAAAAPTPVDVVPPKSKHYPSPKRCFSSYDDMSLKRRVICPLVRSKSFHLSSTEVGPEDLYIVEPLRFSPEKKKKRCKIKPLDKVETLKPSDPSAPLTNGDIKCNGFHPCLPPPLPTLLLPPQLPPPPPPPSVEETPALPPCSSKESPSETSSSRSSSHSEESFAGRLPPPSPIFSCTELPLAEPLQPVRPPPVPAAKSRQEKRSTKRRKSRQTELAEGHVASLPGLQQLMKRSKDLGVGTIRVTAVSGHV